jgi:putative DNA primase/helicase
MFPEPEDVARTPREGARRRAPLAPTGLGNAERFVSRHGADVRYLPHRKKWLLWSGTHWKVDTTLGVWRLATDTVRAISTEVRKLDSADARKEMALHAIASEREARLRAMLAIVQSRPEIAIAPDALDRDPMLLPCENGTIDLRTGELRDHDRRHLITKAVPAPYQPDAEAPQWQRFLDTVLAGDRELERFLQRAVGYSLTGLTTERALFFLYGHGRNGKSKFLEVLRTLLAGYTVAADFGTFIERKNEGTRNDVATLQGARLVTSSEVGEGKRLNESLIKTLTGDETISARFLYGEFFEFKPAFKLWLAANHRPVIRGTDGGIWDRVRLVPFTVRIPDEQEDKHLAAKLIAELPGILAWAVAGCLAWQREGLGMPPAVRVATAEYRRDSDTLGAFIEDLCELGPHLEESATTLYEAYTRWCKDSGEYQLTLTTFGNRLQERGITGLKRGGKKYRVGIGLRMDAVYARSRAAAAVAQKPEDAQGGLLI